MRILITEQGENTIKQIEDSNEYQRAKTLTYGNTFRKSKKLPYETYMKYNYYKKNNPKQIFSKTTQNFFPQSNSPKKKII